MKNIFLAVAVMILSSSTAFAQSEREKFCVDKYGQYAPIKQGATVALLGDSLAEGLGRSFRSLSRDSGYSPVVVSKRGSTTTHWKSVLLDVLGKNRPGVVLLSLGTNDSGDHFDNMNKFVYRDVVDMVKRSGSTLVWILPHKFSSKKLVHEQEVRSLIKYYSPISLEFQDVEIPLAKDGIHPTSRGYDVWMKHIWESLSRMCMIR